jgi:pyrimidine-nucleoside phosphorylase
MRAVDIIQKKRDGGVLTPEEIQFFIAGVTDSSLPDYQTAALLMAVCVRGMTADETSLLTTAMVESGQRLDLSDIPGAKVDKHSTGGVGDKTSLIIAPLVASCGGVVPMMSGRGLGHTGGTLDKLESIPGFRTNLSAAEMRQSLSAIGCALIGQTAEVAPADKRLYALRDVTGTIESIPLISASIMSKKIAEGIDALVLDVKSGSGAFMKTQQAARALAASLVGIGRSAGVRTEAVLTSMSRPLGVAVGNSNEVIECIELMKGRGRADLIDLSLELSERMLVLAGLADDRADAVEMCRRALGSGQALERFRSIIERQGGNPRVVDDYDLLPRAPKEHVLAADSRGFVTRLDAELVGRASVALGAGRDKVDEAVDPAVGIMIPPSIGDAVSKGDAIFRIGYRDESRLCAALRFLKQAVEIGETPVAAEPLILDEVLG